MALPFAARTFDEAMTVSRAYVGYGRLVLAQLPRAREYKRDSEGRFGSGGDGVRESLANAKTTQEVAAAVAAEAKRITGRDIAIDFAGSDVQIAREHGEGVLQGVERFPNSSLTLVTTYGPGAGKSALADRAEAQAQDSYAVTTHDDAPGLQLPGGFVTTGSGVAFNNARTSNVETYRADLRRMNQSGHSVASTPRGVALHEFGHVVAEHGRPSQPEAEVYKHVQAKAGAAGAPTAHYVEQHVSRYAASSQAELTGEIFADVMLNGSNAAPVSRSAFKVLEGQHQGFVKEVGLDTGVPPANRAHFHALVAQSRARLLAREYKRDEKGRFGSGSGVREALMNASTTEDVSAVLAGEATRITGRQVRADLSGSDVQVAREHAEGILRGYEKYPAADVYDIYTYGPGGARPDAFTEDSSRAAYAVAGVAPRELGGMTYVHTIGLNTKFAGDADRYRESLNHGEGIGWTVRGGPMSTALHEFGHHVARQTQAATAAKQIAVEHARNTSEKPSAAIRSKVSEYAATNSHELAAEAFADVMLHGAGASKISQVIVEEIDARYAKMNPLVALSRARLWAREYKRDEDGKFAGHGVGSPDAMHQEDQLRAAYAFTDPVTGYRTEVVSIFKPGDANPDGNERRRHPTVPPGRTMVTVRILDADGKRIGQACRTVHPPSQARVNHNYLVVHPDQRGQGFATRFNAHAEETYRANGIAMITLHANIDVGGYAWARAGYDFRNGQTRSATSAHAYVESVTRGHPQESVDRFRALSRDGKATPLDIAMVGHTPGASTWPGKEIMLESDWQGVKVL